MHVRMFFVVTILSFSMLKEFAKLPREVFAGIEIVDSLIKTVACIWVQLKKRLNPLCLYYEDDT